MPPRNLRIQDITARTSKVNLAGSIRVLRSLVMILDTVYDEGELARKLESILNDSAQLNGKVKSLNAIPDNRAAAACYKSYEMMVEKYGDNAVRKLAKDTITPHVLFTRAVPKVDPLDDNFGNR